MNVRPDKHALRISAKTRVNTTIHVIHNKTVKYKTINQFAWNVSAAIAITIMLIADNYIVDLCLDLYI